MAKLLAQTCEDGAKFARGQVAMFEESKLTGVLKGNTVDGKGKCGKHTSPT